MQRGLTFSKSMTQFEVSSLHSDIGPEAALDCLDRLTGRPLRRSNTEVPDGGIRELTSRFTPFSFFFQCHTVTNCEGEKARW